MTNKIGFFRKSKQSNTKLVLMFEKIQKIRFESSDSDWQDKDFVKRLMSLEKQSKSEILKLLKDKKLKTSDDFYRASFIFHHGYNFEDYMVAVSLSSISHHLGEPWAKNFYAVALDRLLLNIGLPQHFGSQFSKKNGEWQLEKINDKTTDKERAEHGIEALSLIKKRMKNMDKITSWETSLKD
ncbi:MAG: hypothetical protein QMD92_04415 [bacterium]|nr:hypothetical protein [bacterium]